MCMYLHFSAKSILISTAALIVCLKFGHDHYEPGAINYPLKISGRLMQEDT